MPQLRAAFGPDQHSVIVTRVESGVALYTVRHTPNNPTRIWAFAISPDEKFIATAGRDTTARLWKAATGQLVRVVTAQSGFGDTSNHAHEGGYIWSVAFSPDSRLLATGGYLGQVRVWSVKTGRLRADLGRFGGTGNPPGVVVRFNSDGRSVTAAEQHAGERTFDLPNDVLTAE
jgi:WD40 repeat protein